MSATPLATDTRSAAGGHCAAMRRTCSASPTSRRTKITLILDTADAMKEIASRPIKKVPALRGKTVVNLFFEPSTRTRTSFEIAEKRLSADTLNIAIATSSVVKGETLADTALNLEAMRPDMIVLRHSSSGACHLLSRICRSAIINAGDGMHEHPTQALLDAFTIRERKKQLQGIEGRHRRRPAAQPRAAVEHPAADEDGRRCVGVRTADADADRHRALRRHRDEQRRATRCGRGRRHDAAHSARADGRRVLSVASRVLQRLRDDRGAGEAARKPDVMIMHPGPMNRGVEIASEVADGPYSVILDQVANGVAVRMAVLYLLAGGAEHEEAA